MMIKGIDKETKKTSLVGNEVSIDMALEDPALAFILGNCLYVNLFFLKIFQREWPHLKVHWQYRYRTQCVDQSC